MGMEKPACYAICPAQTFLFDTYETLEDTIQRRQASDDPAIRLDPGDVAILRQEQGFLAETSETATATCRGAATSYVLRRTVEAGPVQAVPNGSYCQAKLPMQYMINFGRPSDMLDNSLQLPDDR